MPSQSTVLPTPKRARRKYNKRTLTVRDSSQKYSDLRKKWRVRKKARSVLDKLSGGDTHHLIQVNS